MLYKSKFIDNLSDLILSGEKDTTWRIEDDKNLYIGDDVLFIKSCDLTQVAKCVLFGFVEIFFGELDDLDWDWHEKFSSDRKMYETYSKYYSKIINMDSKLKIIKFKILEKL
jgi:hypothetical protein